MRHRPDKRRKRYGKRKMIPYGLRKKGTYMKEDHHIHNNGHKVLNWWESEYIDKTSERMRARTEIEQEVQSG